MICCTFIHEVSVTISRIFKFRIFILIKTPMIETRESSSRFWFRFSNAIDQFGEERKINSDLGGGGGGGRFKPSNKISQNRIIRV